MLRFALKSSLFLEADIFFHTVSVLFSAEYVPDNAFALSCFPYKKPPAVDTSILSQEAFLFNVRFFGAVHSAECFFLF